MRWSCRKDLCGQDLPGRKRERPELDACLAALVSGDVLVIWKLDRLGRSMVHLCDITESLLARGVGFKVVTQASDTTTAGGKLFFHMLAAIAEFERTLISERTKAGVAAAKRRGVKLGPPQRIMQKHYDKLEGILAAGHDIKYARANGVKISERQIYKYLRNKRLAAAA